MNVKKIGRGGKRRALGWTLLSFGVIVAGVWVWSASRTSLYVSGRWCLVCSRGNMILMRDVPLKVTGWHTYVRPVSERSLLMRAAFDWNPELWRTPRSDLWLYADLQQPGTGVTHDLRAFAFWPVPLLLWTPAALLLRSGTLARRRAVMGSCPACGYDRRGLAPGAVCPECGKG